MDKICYGIIEVIFLYFSCSLGFYRFVCVLVFLMNFYRVSDLLLEVFESGEFKEVFRKYIYYRNFSSLYIVLNLFS